MIDGFCWWHWIFAGAKSDYGNTAEGTESFDHPTSDQTQFGLEGKTASYGKEPSDPLESYETGTGTGDATGYGATPTGSALDETPLSSGETQPAGHGFGPEDTCTHHSISSHLCLQNLDWMVDVPISLRRWCDRRQDGSWMLALSKSRPLLLGHDTRISAKGRSHIPRNFWSSTWQSHSLSQRISSCSLSDHRGPQIMLTLISDEPCRLLIIFWARSPISFYICS